MEVFGVNLYAVLAGGVAAMVIGGLWYGPIMGKTWMELTGFDPENAGNPGPTMAKSFVANLVLAFGIGMVMHGKTEIIQGIHFGLLMAVVIHGAGGISNYLFEQKPMKLFLVHMGNSVLAMMAMGALHAYFNTSLLDDVKDMTGF